MKSKMLALILTLTVISWAQTATPTTPSTPQQGTASEKAKGACCDKMSDAKSGHAACMRNHDGKDMASCCAEKDGKSCCGGKDGKSCMKDDKTAASCCKDSWEGKRQGCFLLRQECRDRMRQGMLRRKQERQTGVGSTESLENAPARFSRGFLSRVFSAPPGARARLGCENQRRCYVARLLRIGPAHFIVELLEKLGTLLGTEFAFQLLQCQGHDVIVMCTGELGVCRNVEP